MLKKVVHCTLLNFSQYLPFKFHYVQRLLQQEVPKISMEIDFLGPHCASACRHPLYPGTHAVLGNILFRVGAFEHSFCVWSIFHMWYLKV